MFDAKGRIVTRVGTDIPFLKKENFFELLSDEERLFFEERADAFVTKKLLVDTTRGPSLIFCGLFPETGLFVAVVFHTPRETLRDFWKNGSWGDTLVSPTLMKKTLPRKRGVKEDAFKISECFGHLSPLFDFGVRRLPIQNGEYFVATLGSMVCCLARCFGCEISLRTAKRALFSNSWVFSMPSFAAIMACLISLTVSSSVTGKAKIEIFEEDGRVFVCFDAVLAYWRDKKSKAHCCEYSELKDCRKIAERHDLLLDIVLNRKEEGAALSVRFSPEYQDISFLGFKNPLGFRG